ncbi:MAG: helix-turn-helix transcriptional regulator [Bacteroidaceae bacterium]|nr:helix-turn-helix transcriptional regulator [Bacteroidaceae bacterium]
MKEKTLAFLEANESTTPSKWREEAQWRHENASWLRHSQHIAVRVLLKMKELNLTQKALAERMDCTQQYVSKILKGKENLSLDTLTRLENALQIRLVMAESYATQPSEMAEELLV